MTLNGSNGNSVFMDSGGPTSSTTDLVVPFSNNHAVFTVNIMDYSATDKHKTVLTRASTAASSVWAIAGRVATTSAITSVAFIGPDDASDQFLSGSTFALYGIVS